VIVCPFSPVIVQLNTGRNVRLQVLGPSIMDLAWHEVETWRGTKRYAKHN
jgi:hypothetical protein